MSDFLEELKSAINSGHWWDRPWWRDPLYQAEAGLEALEVERAFQTLIEVFDEAWANGQIDGLIREAKTLVAAGRLPEALRQFAEEQFQKAKCRNDEFGAARFLLGMLFDRGPSHPMFCELFGRSGLLPFSFLYELGRDLELLRADGLLGDLPGRLRDSREFDGAFGELNALARWVAVGVKVERNVHSGAGDKNCDWKVSDGQNVIYGEVKCLQIAKTNRVLSALVAGIFGRVMARLKAAGIRGRLDLELLIRPESLNEVQEFALKADATADEITRHVEQHVGEEGGVWQVVAGLAKYCHVGGKDAEVLHGSFAGIPYDFRWEAAKIMKVVRNHASQLPASGPGVMMLAEGGRAASLPFAHETGRRIVERFRVAGRRYAHISGVLVLKSLFVLGQGAVQLYTYVPNPEGTRLNLELLKRGFPNLRIWGHDA